jgi:hypothetical protein
MNEKNNGLEWVGEVLHRPDFPMILNSTRSNITGWLYTLKLNGNPVEVLHNTFLVAQKCNGNSNNNTKIFCKVKEVRSFKDKKATFEASVDQLAAIVELEPKYEISDDYEGEVRTQDISDFKLRFPTDEELVRVYGIPQQGIVLGSWQISYNKNLEYKYRVESIYESMFVTGVQRSGKTNFLKFLISQLSQSQEKPAIIVLDVEGEYFHTIIKLGILNSKEYVLSMGEDSEYTLPLSGIAPEDVQYFMPEIPPKTSEIIESYSRKIFQKLVAEGKLNKKHFIGEMQYQIQLNPNLHFSQKPAIIRSLMSNSFDLFDQENKKPITPEELLIPGKVSVINLSNLDHDTHQRTAALYFLTMLYHYKLTSKNPLGVILIVDEARRLFPKDGKFELRKEYISRIAKKVADINHQGRKRKYGIVFATQSPTDINSQIISLCNTKVCFRLPGHKNWIREFLGKEFLQEMEDLPTGTAVIACTGQHEPLKIKIPKVT